MREEELRRILADEAGSVEVAPDALHTIRARIARRRRRWSPRWGTMLAFTGGTAVVAAAAVALALVHPPKPAVPPAPGGAPSGPTANLPVYYLGGTSLGVRLFREYHVLPLDAPDGAARARAALGAMLVPGGAADPEYSTPWSGATVGAVRLDGTTLDVDLRGVATTTPPPDPRMAVQQLVWTGTAASGAATTVRLTLDGRTVPKLWGVPGLDAPLTRASRTDVQAPVWLIDPQHGTEPGHTFSAYLAATAPDGTAGLRVTRADGTVVSDQRVTLSAAAPQLGEAHVPVTLPPGRYTVTAYLPGPPGAPDRDHDSHAITVG
jgi:hypothetical protein